MNMTAEKVRQRPSSTPVRDVQHVYVALLFEHFSIQMLRGPDAGRPHANFAGICFCVGDQFTEGFCRK